MVTHLSTNPAQRRVTWLMCSDVVKAKILRPRPRLQPSRPRPRPAPLRPKAAIGPEAKAFKHMAVTEIKICCTSDSLAEQVMNKILIAFA